jgi:ABC-type nitrate/sulfonate/bicarbonate transport system ATPase subunit
MFQEARLLPWQRVRDNVGLGILSRPQVDNALSYVGLADRGGDWPGVLSGGSGNELRWREHWQAVRVFFFWMNRWGLWMP